MDPNTQPPMERPELWRMQYEFVLEMLRRVTHKMEERSRLALRDDSPRKAVRMLQADASFGLRKV